MSQQLRPGEPAPAHLPRYRRENLPSILRHGLLRPGQTFRPVAPSAWLQLLPRHQQQTSESVLVNRPFTCLPLHFSARHPHRAIDSTAQSGADHCASAMTDHSSLRPSQRSSSAIIMTLLCDAPIGVAAHLRARSYAAAALPSVKQSPAALPDPLPTQMVEESTAAADPTVSAAAVRSHCRCCRQFNRLRALLARRALSAIRCRGIGVPHMHACRSRLDTISKAC